MITQGDLIIRHHHLVFVSRLHIVDIVAWLMITQGDHIIRHHHFVLVSRLHIVDIVAWFMITQGDLIIRHQYVPYYSVIPPHTGLCPLRQCKTK
jgi:hypothetical protein